MPLKNLESLLPPNWDNIYKQGMHDNNWRQDANYLATQQTQIDTINQVDAINQIDAINQALYVNLPEEAALNKIIAAIELAIYHRVPLTEEGKALKDALNLLKDNCKKRLQEIFNDANGHPLTQIIKTMNQHMIEQCKRINAFRGISQETFLEQQDQYTILLGTIQQEQKNKSKIIGLAIGLALKELTETGFFHKAPELLSQLENALNERPLQACIITFPASPILYLDALVDYIRDSKENKKKADYELRYNSFIKALGILAQETLSNEAIIDGLHREEQSIKAGYKSSKYKQLLWGLTRTVARSQVYNFTEFEALRAKAKNILPQYQSVMQGAASSVPMLRQRGLHNDQRAACPQTKFASDKQKGKMKL